MEKKLITLEVPCLGEQYDIFVPVELQLSEMLKLITNAVINLAEGRYSPSGRELLCIPKTKEIMDPRCSLADYRIGNGDHLMLF